MSTAVERASESRRYLHEKLLALEKRVDELELSRLELARNLANMMNQPETLSDSES